MKTYYYKHFLENGVICYESSCAKNTSEYYTELSEDEYNQAISELQKEEYEEYSPSYEELENKITELERENAALLYENLTGEVFTDV